MSTYEPPFRGKAKGSGSEFNRMPNMTPELLQVSRVPVGAPEACMRVVRKNMDDIDADVIIEMLGLQGMVDANSLLTD